MIIKDLHPLMEYLRHHPHVGELFTFLVAFAESLPIIGTIIPGTITMTIVGFLIGTHALPALLTLIIATVGALSGDTIGFALGFWYNEGLRNVWPFKKNPHWLTLGEEFVKKHGGKSIIIGRFVGPARSTVPMIAGLLKLGWVRYFAAAIPSALLWAIVYTIPGIILGALSREIPHGDMTKFLVTGITIIAVVWFLFWVIQHFFAQLAQTINHLTNRAWRYLSRPKHGNWFIRLIRNQQNPDDHHQLTLAIFAAVSAILFLILFVNVRMHTVLTALNEPVFHLLQSIHTPSLTSSMIIATIMGSPKTMLLLTALFTIGFAVFKQWRAAAHMIAAYVLSAGAAVVFKNLSHSLRPQGFYFVAPTSSFPSGHATLSFVIIGFLAFLIGQTIAKSTRWIPYLLATLFIITVGFSRIYLGAHWLTDIIGSVLLALPVIFVCIISYHRMPKETGKLQLSRYALALIIIVSFACTWTTQIMRNFKQEKLRYTRIWPTVSITEANWWENSLQYTPLYRPNRLGQPFQPFNVQWLGSLSGIKQTLTQSGWQTLVSHSKLRNTLKRFASFEAQYHMPLLPWLYQHKAPVLLMIKHVPQHRMILELRLWKNNITITNSKNALWIGAVDVRLPPKKLLSVKDRSTVTLIANEGFHALEQDVSSLKHKIIQADPSKTDKKALIWNGKILLVVSG